MSRPRRIYRSFRLKEVAEPVLVRGKPDEAVKARLRELGAAVARAIAG